MSGLVIVGAGPLIGRAVARRFAKEGLPVAVVARGGADAVVDDVRADGGTARGYRADATDEAALRGALDAVVRDHGVPDVLVYNAAVIRADRVGELDARGLLDTLAVNVVGAAVAAAHLGPRMAARGSGSILVTGGMPDPKADYASLSLGKAGVRTLVALLAEEYGPAGVHAATVTVADAVVPGTAYDPDLIAEAYWDLHNQPRGAWKREVLFAP